MAADRILSDLGTAVLEQLITAYLLTERLTEVRAHRYERLRTSAEALAGELQRRLPGWEFTMPPGGLALWLSTPGVSGISLARAGERIGVRIAAGSRFGVDGAFENHVRLPLTVSPSNAAEAVARLAEAAEQTASGRWSATDEAPPLAV